MHLMRKLEFFDLAQLLSCRKLRQCFEDTRFVEDVGSRNVNMKRSLKSGNNTETRLYLFALVANTVLPFCLASMPIPYMRGH